ncbi:uncharacterized protein LOC129232690 [Uloborus diversus]|uniref:uncharacterized protein LOC129232690 n=1 Tax=Uloborus diversus TaxID=327109 RepID=UPI002409AA39|nr:uncharacterized protein LOC129232690 [Uloborus diversus]
MIQKLCNINGFFINIIRSKSYKQGSVLESYWNKIRDGEFTLDKSQLKLIEILDDLKEQSSSYVVTKPNVFSKLFGKKKVDVPKGLYIYGSVEKLKDDNYSSWCSDMKFALIDRNLWNIVTGKETKPEISTD